MQIDRFHLATLAAHVAAGCLAAGETRTDIIVSRSIGIAQAIWDTAYADTDPTPDSGQLSIDDAVDNETTAPGVKARKRR